MNKPNKPYLLISAIPTEETTDWNRGRALLSALVNTSPKLMPEKTGVAEPLKVTVSDIDDCQPYWAIADDSGDERLKGNADSIMWKRSRAIRSSGHMIHRHQSKSGRVRLGRFIFRADFDRRCDWNSLFEEVCSILLPEYATMHYFGDLEQSPEVCSQEALESYGFNDHLNGLSFVSMEERGFANIAWANYFCSNRLQVISDAGIESAGFSVQDMGVGKIIRVTRDISEVVDDFPAFSRRRAILKDLFRAGTFRIKEEPRSVGYEA